MIIKPVKSDLARIDRMRDVDIDYSDIPALDKMCFKKATVKLETCKLKSSPPVPSC